MLATLLCFLLLVKISIRADIFGNLETFHVKNLGSRNLVGVLDGALANFLIGNGLVDTLLHSLRLASSSLVLVTLVSVLVSLYITSSQTLNVTKMEQSKNSKIAAEWNYLRMALLSVLG